MPSIEQYFISAQFSYSYEFLSFQEDQNRGKPNWEHLNDELHVLITVEDSENRAQMKLQRAIDEVKKLLTVVCKFSCNKSIYLIKYHKQ